MQRTQHRLLRTMAPKAGKTTPLSSILRKKQYRYCCEKKSFMKKNEWNFVLSKKNCRQRMNRFPVQLGTDCTRNRLNLNQETVDVINPTKGSIQMATVVSQKDLKGTVLIAVTLVNTHLFGSCVSLFRKLTHFEGKAGRNGPPRWTSTHSTQSFTNIGASGMDRSILCRPWRFWRSLVSSASLSSGNWSTMCEKLGVYQD